MAINELRAISIFIKTAQLGSLRKAAVALDLSPQAASQALAQLERHLDVRLFHRTTRVLSLTAEGQRLLDEAQPALLSLERAMRQTQQAKTDIAGPLRIVGPRTTFVPILWSLLEEFCTVYPNIQPDVQLEDNLGNWVEERVDVGFRLGSTPEEGVIARTLFPLQLVVCATPDYFSQYGVPDKIADLASHRCSVFRYSRTQQILPWCFKINGEIIYQPMQPSLCSNDETLELKAVLAGRCIAQLTGASAAPYLRSGTLLPVLTQHMPEVGNYFVYYGSRHSQPVRARAFIEFTLQKLVNSTEYVLSTEELKRSEQQAKQLIQLGY